MKKLLTVLMLFLVAFMAYSQETAQDFYKKGSNAEHFKRYKRAVEFYTEAIMLDSTFGDAWASRGMMNYHLKNYLGAVDDFDMALQLIPNYAEVYDLRGLAKYELTDKDGACNDWNKSFELGFNNAYDLIEKYCIGKRKK